MEPNRYAPPVAIVADLECNEAAPPLWNPDSAASWSLMFTPIFGSWLHMKNWEALGEVEKAASSRNWLTASMALIVGMSLLSALPQLTLLTPFARLIAFVLLLSWYFASAKAQSTYVKERFGK